MSAPATSMITGIGDMVDGAIDTVTGKVDGVRNAGAEPCYKLGIIEEALANRRNQERGWRATVAAYRLAGERAVEASINNQGRASSAHAGGRRFAAHLAETAIPVPDGVILAAIFGGPIGAGAAQGAWVDWIDARLPSGRPSASRRGSRVLGMADVRVYGGRLQGPAVRAAWDSWVVQQALVVGPHGKPNWREKVERVEAKLDALDGLLAELETQRDQWEQLCIEDNGRGEARIDATLAAQLQAVRDAQRTERLRALAPYALGGLLLVGIIRRRR